MSIPGTVSKLWSFYKLKTSKKLSAVFIQLIETLVRRWVLGDPSIIRGIFTNRYRENQKKQIVLDNLGSEVRTIFFVFRDLHILDWFTPIDRALTAEYPGKYQIIYIDYGSTLKPVGDGFGYFTYQGQIEERLLKSGITDFVHFSDQEIALFSNFPAPDIIVTSETIRHEQFDCSERVYIPHYSVPKLKAVIPKHISFNHLFLAVRPPFCYNELLNNEPISATIHEVGYPKMHARPESEIKLFESNNPVVIFAPSVETEIVLHALEKGILKTFKRMTDLNFIIKLHPTLSAGMFDLSQYIQKQIDGFGNIILDARNSIQSISMDSSLLINDFGSAGAEYRLSFGKRLIYIDVPDYLNGGADLRFRDAFADGRSNIYDLEEVIRSVLAMGDLTKQEWQDMCERTLFSYGFADRTAAQVINGILPGS